jgi:hypothetical protein
MLSRYRLLSNNVIRQQTSNVAEMQYLPAVWVAYPHCVMNVLAELRPVLERVLL